MGETFRQSVNLLHTWTGVILGSVLFAIFWMGTLSVFDHEIDRWMMPWTRIAPSPHPVSSDALVPFFKAERAQTSWTVVFPTERQPTLIAIARDAGWSVLRRF